MHGSPVVESRAPSLNRGGLLVCSPEDDTHFPETQVDVDMVDGQVAPSVVAVEPASQAGQGLRRNLTGLFEEVADECHVDPSPIGAEQELQEPDLCFMDVEHDRKDTYPFEQELQDPCGPTPIHAEQELPETDLCPIHAEQKLPETDLCEKEQQENDLASIPSIDASFTRKDQRRMKKTKVAEQRRRKINHAPGEAHEGQEEEDDAEAVSSEQRGRGRGGRGRGGGGRGARGRGGRGSGGGGRKRGRSRSQSAESEPQVLRRPAAKSLAKPSKPQDAKRKAQANPKPEPKPKKAKVDESVRKACEGQGVDEVVTFILSDIDALKTKTALKISKLPVMQRIDEIPIQHELRSEYKKSFGSIWKQGRVGGGFHATVWNGIMERLLIVACLRGLWTIAPTSALIPTGPEDIVASSMHPPGSTSYLPSTRLCRRTLHFATVWQPGCNFDKLQPYKYVFREGFSGLVGI